MAFAQKHSDQKKPSTARKRGRPDLNRPEDRQRIVELFHSVTMDVDDAAWLYSISRSAAYDACHSGEIATKKFADRIRVVSTAVFNELFPQLPRWLSDTVPPAA